ncbi:MAG TPA: hypothetical protein PKA64_20740 [Myxococcota bacterium]|nr:hypothetical protein [Myxococcota bacterium]
MKQELEALQAQLAALQERVDQGPRLPGRKPPRPPTSLWGPNGFHVDLTGYYRARFHDYGVKLGANKPVTGGLLPNQETPGRYANMRLRLGVSLAWKDQVSLNLGVQALDNVLWGDNAGKASLALFGEDPSETRLDGTEAPPIQVFRAWGETKLPIGVIRVGRQSSHWGMGLLANGGDGFDDDFGENYYGNTFDRFLFATNPVSIVQAFTKKKEDQTIPLTLAIAVDRLVEDPLTQYYGYRCEPGVYQETDPDRYDARCDSDGDGLTDLDHGYDEDREEGSRRDDWWVDQNDDVWEMVYALIYRGQQLDWFAGGDFTAGAYLIHRLQRETSSNVVVGDLYLDMKTMGFNFQFEGVGILGRTRAITLPDSQAADPLAKKASISGYAARLSYEQRKWKVLFESGFASGDDNVNDGLFTGRALHPDFNVGLLLYEDVIARVTQNLWGDSARGLRSRGGVYDSHYIFPRVYAMPMRDLQLIAGVLAAFPAKADGAIIRCNEKDQERFGCPVAAATASMLGYEVDLAAKMRMADHFLASLETGWAHATDRLALDAAGLATTDKGTGNFWTLQARFAWEL